MIDAIIRRANFVRAECDQGVSRAVEECVRRWTENLAESGNVVPREGVSRALTLDLMYCMTRHRQWVDLDSFGALVIEFLGQDYGLSRTDAEALLRGARAAMFDHDASRSSGQRFNDIDFLRYLFVMGATARDERQLVIELGLGQGVLRHLRRAAEFAARGGDSSFQTDIDSRIAVIMRELGSELREYPHALDVRRLGIRVGGDRLIVGDARLAMRLVFELLVKVGAARGWTTRQTASWMAGQGENPDVVEWLARQVDPVEAVEGVMRALESLGLLYRLESTRGDRRWRLSETGEDLTAEAFATTFANRAGASTRAWEHYGTAYQSAIARRMPLESVFTCGELIRAGRFVGAPEAAVQILRRFAGSSDPKVFAALAREALAACRHRREREAVCEACAYAPPSEMVSSILESVASGKEYSDARGAAIEAVRHRERRFRSSDAQVK